jgi:hypothetical protein
LKKDLNIWFPATVRNILDNETGKKASKLASQLQAHDCRIYRVSINKVTIS